jgi:hypothetical protein
MSVPGFSASQALYPAVKAYRSSRPPRPIVVRPEYRRSETARPLMVPRDGVEAPGSGRAAWKALEESCEILKCHECRQECRAYVSGLHDLVNLKLGKPMQNRSAFIFLRNALNTVYESAL